MTWKDLNKILMRMPICELKKEVVIRAGGDDIKLKVEHDAYPDKVDWKGAADIKDLRFVVK